MLLWQKFPESLVSLLKYWISFAVIRQYQTFYWKAKRIIFLQDFSFSKLVQLFIPKKGKHSSVSLTRHGNFNLASLTLIVFRKGWNEVTWVWAWIKEWTQIWRPSNLPLMDPLVGAKEAEFQALLCIPRAARIGQFSHNFSFCALDLSFRSCINKLSALCTSKFSV